ncbi:MAG: hypothetical protein PHF00_04870 [Elusimicrobia bacterium]|nr:hypothetical protein [Elusimicrobiota bacterium]
MRKGILIAVFAGLLAGSARAAVMRTAPIAGRAGMAGVPFAVKPGALNVPGQQLQAPLAVPPGLTSVLPRTQSPLVAQPAPAAFPQTAAALPAAQPAQAPALQALESFQTQALKNDAAAEAGPASAWTESARGFDGLSFVGGPSAASPDLNGYRRLDYNEDAKVRAAMRYAVDGSETSRSLDQEFQNRGGYFLLDPDRGDRYMAAATEDSYRRPVIVLTWDLLNRDNGRWEDIYRGAPWQFIASVIAREQVFFNAWYDAIPASADKLAVSFMNMVRVFVDLTNGTSRSWATDKDYAAVQGDRSSYVEWNWFEQLVNAARAAAQGVGTNTGHLIESTFFTWARDLFPYDQSSGFGYSLWEQFDRKYFRPGDSKDGQSIPAAAPRLDEAAYNSASYKAYGADGKGSFSNGGTDEQTVFGWIIKWLKDRFEI